MDHVAIDLGGKESQICVRRNGGEIVEETRCATRQIGKYLAKMPPSRVVLETCAEAFAVADQARVAGHEVVVVPALLVRALGVGERGLKNDRRDAQNLSRASCQMERLPQVHVPTPESRERKSLCGMREVLVTTRTKLINSVRGWLRGGGIGAPRTGGTGTFTRRVREHLERNSRSLPGFVARQLHTIDLVDEQICEAEKELTLLAKTDATAKRLMTVPGVGPVTSIRLIAAVDDISRFSSAHTFQSYFGLTPGEDSSSEKQRRTAITKAGAKAVRWALIQAAWSAWRTRQEHPMVQWAKNVAERRGKRVAVVALARKIAGVLYAMWRNGTTYNPLHRAVPESLV
jgi:transposase